MTTRNVGETAFDSNVLIYAIAGSGAKRDAALQALGQGGAMSVQALNEVAHVLRRKARFSLAEVTDALAVLRSVLRVIPMTEAVHDGALRVAAMTHYSIWDAAMVAAALEEGCETLLSEDMQDGRVIDGLTIRNPF